MKNQPPICVGIVSDVRLYREGIAQSLSFGDRFTVLGTASDLSAALSLCEKPKASILLLDMGMTDSLKIVRSISDKLPDVKVVAFAIDEVEDDVIACAEAGIAGYVPRQASLEELAEIVESASRNELICSPKIASGLLGRLAARRGRVGHPAEASLTPRQRQIWRMLDRGLANKEIATELGISVITAKNHVHNLLDKLKVSSRAEAAALRHRRRPMLPSRRHRRRAS